MNQYGQAAVEAVRLCGQSAAPDPVAAWSQAVRNHLPTKQGQKKCCPKSTFLGLCEEGFVQGVPRGNYTRSVLNKSYALCAVKLLQGNKTLSIDPLALWLAVMAGAEKRANGQMDVVLALWQAKLLIMN